jgi:hypothetical protein
MRSAKPGVLRRLGLVAAALVMAGGLTSCIVTGPGYGRYEGYGRRASYHQRYDHQRHERRPDHGRHERDHRDHGGRGY